MSRQTSEQRPLPSLLTRVLANRWTIVKSLGTGGTATVYEAVHRNGRRVAVKVLHPELAHHPAVRERFQCEGYAANRVRHPDAVAVLDDGEEPDGTAFLVMELLEGESLAKRLADRGPLSAVEVAATAASVLDVLAAAHDNGVVHRDVKPANIFLTNDGRIKLLDFGVARVAELAGTNVITQTGSTVGTPAFMAPEQAAGHTHDIDALTDIWAVGATMFQLLTQRLVHVGSSTNSTVVAAATTPAPRLQTVAPDVPLAIARVVDRALAFGRGERWPNARSMRRALLLACPELLPERPTEPPSLETEPEGVRSHTGIRTAPRRPSKIRTISLAALILLSLAVFVAWRSLSTALPAPPAPSAARSVSVAGDRTLGWDTSLVARSFAPPTMSLPEPSSARPARAPQRNAKPSASTRGATPTTPSVLTPSATPLREDALLDRRK